MKRVFGHIIALLFALVCCVAVANSSVPQCGTDVMVENYAAAGDMLSADGLVDLSEGNFSEALSSPVQSLVRNNTPSRSVVRLVPGQEVSSVRGCRGYTSHHSCKQYGLTSPFYCMLSCEYYVFALKRLII